MYTINICSSVRVIQSCFLECRRFPRERQTVFFLLLYMPLGVILTILRICISLQALLYLLIIPNGFVLKRYSECSGRGVRACDLAILVLVLWGTPAILIKHVL